MKKIFRYQIWHLLSVVILITITQLIITNNYILMNGTLWRISTTTWFWIAITIPILHQIYVWLIWRFELYQNTFSSRYGVTKSFKLYTIGFSILFGSRLIFIIILAESNQNSLILNPFLAYLLILIISPLIIYLFYSVKKYFTIERAYGIDHFDKNYNEPKEKRGIFRFTDNGMYIFGLMILYLPGLLLFSSAALAVALFNHVYIWVHYFCTERPDMMVIYEKSPNK